MSKSEKARNWSETRQAVFARDRHRCQNCLAENEFVVLDPDHGVPRGVGGSDRMSNLNTYCRRCHKAKHGEGIAPTIQFESTQRMTEREFHWFKHFVDEMIPVMAQIIGTHLNPKFALEEQKAWHIPLGDVYHLDEQLADYEMEYTTLTQLQEYM